MRRTTFHCFGMLTFAFLAMRIGAWTLENTYGWTDGDQSPIFAVVGKQLGVISATMFSVIVIMVILTTLITPPVLTLLLGRRSGA